jgi:hypothetical protein
MLESGLQRKVLTAARSMGIFCRKVEFPNYAGCPDCIFMFGGVVLWIEFKSPKGTGRLSALQAHTHAEMRAAGAWVEVIDNYEKGMECLKNLISQGSNKKL